MTRLEELLEQKRLIEKEIRTLRDTAVCFGRAKLEKKNYAAPKQWCLSIKKIDPYTKDSRWMMINNSGTKEKAEEDILTIINDLKCLYELLRKEDKDEETL